jgi:hypothetical protein
MKFFDESLKRHSNEYSDAIFVFGSNLAGRHGAGAALYAHDVYEAKYGVGMGRTGQAYAIPTKDAQLNTLALEYIHHQVKEFLEYARHKKDEVFFVTRIGCGLAGYKNEQIAPMFRGAPDNCIFDISWKQILLNTSL